MTKKEELKAVIGKEAPCNWSPTLRGKLIAVYKVNCLWEVVENPEPYGAGHEHVGSRYLIPMDVSNNSFFA
jgi:hypothetical protein